MKNNRIVKAYDSINPSAAEKQRMLDAILAEANLEEKPRKAAKRKEPIVYTAKPTKTSKRSLIGPLAACFAVVIIAGLVFGIMLNRDPVDPVYVEPTTDVTVTGTPYDPVLSKYRIALKEGWTKEQCEIEGISTRMEAGADFTKVGYALLDLDGDGREELLIGHDTLIWDLYTTLEDGTPIQLLSDEQDGWQYYLNEDGLIAAEYFSKDDCYAEYYTLKDHQLVMELQLQYRDSQWMQQLAGQEWEAIIADSAEATMSSFERFTPDWIPLQVHAQTGTDDLEHYTPILEKYKTALAENWTEEKCEQNDISAQILYGTVISNNLGWCLMDIDGNGTNELIISDGDRVYDLYTMDHDNTLEHVLIAIGTNAFNLCQDGILQEQVFFSKGCSWYFYQLSAGKQELINVLTYRNEYEGTTAAEGYYYGTNEDNGQPISKDEAGKILSAYQSMELSLTPFVEAEPFYPDAELYYRPLRELYQRALNEQWDPPTCMENGLSLMVAHRGEYYDQLGYTIKDLDCNGVGELIITDGTNIYDLYTLILDEEVVPLQLASAMERIEYFLTIDDMIYNMGSGGAAVSYHTLYSLEGKDLKLLKGYMMDANVDPDNPWYYYDGVAQGGPCPTAEAAAAMDAIHFAEIPITSFE